jgi:hypothetical protein
MMLGCSVLAICGLLLTPSAKPSSHAARAN